MALSNDVSIAVVDSPDPVLVGMNLVYTLSIANVGPSAATGVIVTNTLPAGATFVSANPSQGTYTQTAGMVTCNLGTIPGGTNATITIVVVPTTGGMTMTNRAAVFLAETDPYLPNNSATTMTIVLAPALSVNDVSLLEGNAGTQTASFTVTLAPAGVLPVTVHYATDDDSARAGTDYVATSGTLSFNPGETSKTITVFVNGDTTGEPDETFVVNLSNPTNAIVVRAQGMCTILNDDMPAAAYLRSTAGRPWGSDSNETDMNRVFGVNNWGDLRYEEVNVDLLLSSTTTFIFMEGGDNNAAQLENFLTAHIVAIQNWVAGGGSLFLNAAPNQDDGMSFGFGVTLTFPDFTDTGIAAIPTHPIFNGPFTPVGTFWSGGSFGHATVSGTGLITLIASSSTGHTVLGEMVYGTGRVLFGGMTTDNFHSPQPQAANLRANIMAYLSAQPGPAVSIADASAVEGDVGTTNMVFTVTLASPSMQTITVNYATATNGSAAAGSDYIGTDGVLTFAPGITNRTIAVAVVGDKLVETNETFFVNLTYAINATPGRSQAVGTILDDDGLPGQINHFVWSAIPSPQLVGEPVPLTITAQDYFNNTVTGFTDAVALSIPLGSGQGDDFNRPDGSSLGAIWTQQNSAWHIEDNRARSNPGAGNALMTFSAVVPQPVLYADVFYIGTPRVTYCALVSRYTNLANSVFIKIQDSGSSGSFNTVYFLYGNNASPWPGMTGGSAVVSVAPFTQARITTRVVGDSITLEIDRNFDSLPEDTITRGGIPLGNLGDRVGLAGFNDATIDNFSVGGPPPAVAPMNSGNFAGGIWTGTIAVLQAGTNVTLWADDGRGHIGQSLPFNVTDAARLSIARSENSVVLSWPAAAAGFRLEQAFLLPAETNWVPVTNDSIIAGDRRTFSNSVPGSNTFYRLTKP